jgi:hypothetical protein
VPLVDGDRSAGIDDLLERRSALVAPHEKSLDSKRDTYPQRSSRSAWKIQENTQGVRLTELQLSIPMARP